MCDQENKSVFLDTKTFIKSKCQKDHLSNSNMNSPTKRSIYHDKFKRSKLKTQSNPDLCAVLGRQRNLKFSNIAQLNPLKNIDSKYRSSFQGGQSQMPERSHEKQSYFLKQQNYEKLVSEYKRKMSPENLKNDIIGLTFEKGKAKLDHLLIPKCNKLSSNSEYQTSFRKSLLKFPSIWNSNNPTQIENQKKIRKINCPKKSSPSSLWESNSNLNLGQKPSKML